MQKHIVSSGQDLEDVCLQRYGTLESFAQLLADNPQLSVNSNIASKDEILFDSNQSGVADIVGQFDRRVQIIVNSDEDTLGAAVGDWNDDFNNDFNI